MMKIGFIGSGRVASHLATALAQHYTVAQIYVRNIQKAQPLADSLGAELISEYKKFRSDLDVCIIAVSDQAIEEVIKNLTQYLPNTLIVHTSGSTSIEVLKSYHDRVGIFYPLQTFSLEREIDWKSTPLLLEAHHQADEYMLEQMAALLSDRVYLYDSAQRLSLHLAAVFACNFSNACYDIAYQIVNQQGVDFELLHPLILETAQKATQHIPHTVQTGPAKRQDHKILNLHGTMLTAMKRQDLVQIYALLSQKISDQPN